MARSPRIQFSGANYHILNRGNYRADLFESEGAARAFESCVFEACEKSGWVLHAHTIMRNHYHLVAGTPRGNLVSGVHWLQSTFGNRFNRFRAEHGRAFQSRYKAILIEPGAELLRVVNYVHLNPVRAGLVTLADLGTYPWSSYRRFVGDPFRRPSCLRCDNWLLQGAGLTDTTAGWRSYADLLATLTVDRGQWETAWKKLCSGLASGSAEFQSEMARLAREMDQAADWGGQALDEVNQDHWRCLLATGLSVLGKTQRDALNTPRSAAWKVALAYWLKQHSSAHNRWIGQQLSMGHPDAVSRYVNDPARRASADFVSALAILTQFESNISAVRG